MTIEDRLTILEKKVALLEPLIGISEPYTTIPIHVGDSVQIVDIKHLIEAERRIKELERENESLRNELKRQLGISG